MSRRIFKSTFLISILIFLITMVVTAFVLFNFMEDRTISELKEADDLIAIGIEDYGEEYLEDVKASSVDRRITWIDEDGTVLFDNEADPSNMDNHSTRE